MASQITALEGKYHELRRLIDEDLNSVTSWLDNYVDSCAEQDTQSFQKNMDRQFKLRADLERIDARLMAYARTEPLSAVTTAS